MTEGRQVTQQAPETTSPPDDPRVLAVLSALEGVDDLELPARLDVFAGLQSDLARILDGADAEDLASSPAP